MLETPSKCVEGAPIKYLAADPTLTCWSGMHSPWALGLGLPMLFLFGAGIPLMCFLTLYWRRNKLEEKRCLTV